MMLDVCLEMSGSYAHLIGVDTVHSVLPVRHRARKVRTKARRGRPAPIRSIDVAQHQLSAAIDRLPFLLAHVLWLIDVCGCTYETAAAELGSSPDRVKRLVAEARQQLREELVSDPRRSPGGSTSRSRPGWQPPGR